MKRILNSILVLLLGICLLKAEEFTTGGIYVQVATQDQTCNLISETTNIVEKIVVGKTYRVDADVMELKTKVGESTAFTFSNGLQVQVDPNTTFSVDAFNQLVINNESLPATLKAEYSVMSLGLMDGEIELICPSIDTNSQIIVQTPLVNVNVAKGRIAIKSNPKYVILNAIEGSIAVIDTKNKTSVIDKGHMGIVIPYPGRDGEVLVTQKVISPEELDKLTATLDKLAMHSKDVLFIVLDKKVVGVRLK